MRWEVTTAYWFPVVWSCTDFNVNQDGSARGSCNCQEISFSFCSWTCWLSDGCTFSNESLLQFCRSTLMKLYMVVFLFEIVPNMNTVYLIRIPFFSDTHTHCFCLTLWDNYYVHVNSKTHEQWNSSFFSGALCLNEYVQHRNITTRPLFYCKHTLYVWM